MPCSPGPVGRRNTHRHRPVARPRLAHRGEHFQWIAQPVVEASAIFIVALVLQRREEARQQIAVRGVKLDHVEARLEPHARRRDELVAHLVHVGAGHRRAASGWPATRRQSLADINGQLPSSSGTSLPSHPSLVEPLPPEWPSWRQIFAVELEWTKSTIRRHAATWPADHMPVQPGLIATFGGHAGHLGEHQPSAAQCALAIMDEVKVVRRSVDRRIHRHRRHGDAVFELHLAQLERREHRRRAFARDTRALPEPALDALEPVAVAKAQILVADPLAPGEQRISELQRLEMQIAVERLEPFGRVARAVLELEHLEIALRDMISSSAAPSD